MYAVGDTHYIRSGPFFHSNPGKINVADQALNANMPNGNSVSLITGPIYFGADYVTQQKWRQLGLIRLCLEYSDLGFGRAGLVEDSGMVVTPSREEAKIEPGDFRTLSALDRRDPYSERDSAGQIE